MLVSVIQPLSVVSIHSSPRSSASLPPHTGALDKGGEVNVQGAQSCLTLCNPMGCTGHGILQAGILEWAAFPSSRGSSQPKDRTQVSCVAGRFSTI